MAIFPLCQKYWRKEVMLDFQFAAEKMMKLKEEVEANIKEWGWVK